MEKLNYPVVEFRPRTWEIDEFDCASIFVLEGDEKALVIDTGIGIGNLRKMVEELTDKPVILVMTHGHGDHTGGSGWWDEIYMSEKDMGVFEFPENMRMRHFYANWIATRDPKEFPFDDPKKDYPYDNDTHIQPFENVPRVLPLVDGQVFDLGGRRVVAYEAPGHTPGCVAFIDEKERILFCGDACNGNLGIAAPREAKNFVSIETAHRGLKRLLDMKGEKYDVVYNGHHDYRKLGEPLDDDVLPNAVKAMQQLVEGTAEVKVLPAIIPGKGDGKRYVVKIGTMELSFNPDGIYDSI